MQKVSIITACRNSHEAINRIAKYYKEIELPPHIEWIIVDHCSDPKLENPGASIVRHDDCTSWIHATLMNVGASYARGEYLMFLGIDSWVSPEWIRFAEFRTDNFALFGKKVALLDEGGELSLLPDEDYMNSGVAWVSRITFDYLGGFDTDLDRICFEDTDFRIRYLNEFATLDSDLRPVLGTIALGPYVFTSPEKGSGKRPDFLHNEKKTHQDTTAAEKIMNRPGRLRFSQATKLKAFTE